MTYTVNLDFGGLLNEIKQTQQWVQTLSIPILVPFVLIVGLLCDCMTLEEGQLLSYNLVKLME